MREQRVNVKPETESAWFQDARPVTRQHTFRLNRPTRQASQGITCDYRCSSYVNTASSSNNLIFSILFCRVKVLVGGINDPLKIRMPII